MGAVCQLKFWLIVYGNNPAKNFTAEKHNANFALLRLYCNLQIVKRCRKWENGFQTAMSRLHRDLI